MTENLCSQQRMVAQRVQDILAAIDQKCASLGRDPHSVTLMAVTKTIPPPLINAAIDAGIVTLGENRVQEFLEKSPHYRLPPQGKVHFIGKLQKNKVKYIVDKVSLIESLDDLTLAEEISRQCHKRGLCMDCLVEVNIGCEISKSGVSPESLFAFWAQVSQIPHLRLRGLMCIPPFDADENRLRQYFQQMRDLLVDIRSKNVDNNMYDILSMGMSQDYLLALEYGATQVRIGAGLFGERN